MRRRTLLAGLAGAGALSAGGLLAASRDSAPDTEPVTVETLDAPGSSAGTVSVPPSEGPLLVEFFATTCSVCADQQAVIGEVREAVDGVRFLSVTSEPVGLSVTRGDVCEWWRTHDGSWTVGLDEGTTLAERYDATRVPTTLVLDRGDVSWRHTGRFDADSLVEAVRAVTGR